MTVDHSDQAIRESAANRHEHGSCAGVVLMDVMVAAAVLTIGILNALSASIGSSALQQATAEYVQAHNTSRDVLEQLRGGNLVDQFKALAANPFFEVGDQLVTVSFPEEMLLPLFGGPVPATARFRDLDADGQVELDTAATDNASLLPVRIAVTKGNLNFRLETILTEI